MEWRDRLRAEIPRDQIPAFLRDLQALVAALREGSDWLPCMSDRLRAHPGLVLGYLDPGPKRDAVATWPGWTDYSATGAVGAPTDGRGQRAQGE